MIRILVVEDEPRIASFVRKGLEAAGYAAIVVEDGEQAASAVRRGGFDLVLLDVGLPDRDGISVLRELRERGDRVPVIVVTARDAVADRVAGLDAGADDYVTKPFSLEELLARVRARVRGRGDERPTVLSAGGVWLDLVTRRAVAGGRTAVLTPQEATLAEVLLRRGGQVVPRRELLQRVWGLDDDRGSNVVEVYVGYLRRKLGHDAVATVRGVGYRIG